MNMKLETGNKAPNFEIETSEEKTRKLSDYYGKILVLYFYPKDNTSGCTKQAIEFSEKIEAFRTLGAEILGISCNTVEQHLGFIEKQNLKIVLGSDPSHQIIESYGSWVEKSMYGRKYMGIDRSTFIINAQGHIIKIWRKVRIPKHIDSILEFITKETSL